MHQDDRTKQVLQDMLDNFKRNIINQCVDIVYDHTPGGASQEVLTRMMALMPGARQWCEHEDCDQDPVDGTLCEGHLLESFQDTMKTLNPGDKVLVRDKYSGDTYMNGVICLDSTGDMVSKVIRVQDEYGTCDLVLELVRDLQKVPGI